MATTVFKVADHILKQKKNFDLLQLIKLCYLSYGWYLTYYEEPLFEERIEAWKYGPVIPELYYALKHFRSQSLPADCLKSLIKDKAGHPLQEEAKDLIEEIIKCYGDLSGRQLSALTHKRGTPWYETYKGTKERQPWVYIPNNVIKDHFDELKKS